MRVGIDLGERSLVNESCFGLNIQRAARVVSVKFDRAFKSLAINHWQFDMLVALSVPSGLNVSEVASLLIVDRTTITANLKPLVRAGLLNVRVDEHDARSRRIELTSKGKDVVRAAYPLWKRVNDSVARSIGITPSEKIILGGLASIINGDKD